MKHRIGEKQKKSERSHAYPTDAPPHRRSSAFVGVAFLLILVAGTIGSALTIPEVTVSRNEKVRDGGWMVAFQGSFEEALPYKERFLHLWSAFRYGVFGQGTQGVVVGEDGWLFTAEELTVERGDPARTSAALEEIVTIASTLARHQALLVVAIVPAKARIVGDRLPGFTVSDDVEARYRRILTTLDAVDNIVAPDLLTPLADQYAAATVRSIPTDRSSSTDHDATRDRTLISEDAPHPQPFLFTDTHWTPEGARVAAEAIAIGLRPLLSERAIPSAMFETRRIDREEYRGDLLRFLPVGPYASHLNLIDSELVTRYETIPTGTGGGLFGDPVIPGVLVGTSYSAGERWNFEGFLKDALQADIVNVAVEGQGPFVPMREYLAGETFREFPPRFVVWEIPERYFPQYEPPKDLPVASRGAASTGTLEP